MPNPENTRPVNTPTDFAHILSAQARAVLVGLGANPPEGLLVKASDRPDLGHFQCNAAMSVAKALNQPPRAIAVQLVAAFSADPNVAKAEAAGPGFVNITLSDAGLSAQANRLAADARAGAGPAKTPQNVMVDFGGPNVAKSMHVGHLRSAIIGECLQRVCRFVGDNVTSDIHLGDWGLQMGLLIVALSDQQPDLPFFDAAKTSDFPTVSPVTLEDLERLYPEASARSKADEAFRARAREATSELQAGRPGYRALWQHFTAVTKVTLEREYAALDVHFDLWKGESDVDALIPAMIGMLETKGLIEDDQGARIVRVHEKLSKEGEPDVPPLIIISRDGSAQYGTTDLATILDRKQSLAPDVYLYVVDQRQALHFEQVFRAAAKVGLAEKSALEHIGFGTMNGADGKPFRTRSGDVVKLFDLIETARAKARERLAEANIGAEFSDVEREDIAHKVAIAAIKFADLSNHRSTNYIFDLDRFVTFEGKTGPYLLYACVRLKSLLRKASDEGVSAGSIQVSAPEEAALVLALDAFSGALRQAYERRAPNFICDHVYRVAQAFSSFYAACPVLAEKVDALRASRLGLVELTLKQLGICLDLIGIPAPERM